MEIYNQDDFLDYVNELRRYRKENPPKTNYTSKQWIELYPELKTDFQNLLLKEEIKKEKLIKKIKRKLDIFDSFDSPYNLMGKELIVQVEGKELIEIEKRIRWFRLGLDDKPVLNYLTDEQIQNAREYPLGELVNTKKIKNIWCCPFHEEKTPSFHIYKDNHWHCFGCQKHGKNAIDFVMEKQKLSFSEAVKYLGGSR